MPVDPQSSPAWDQAVMGSLRQSSPTDARLCRHLLATCPHCSCDVIPTRNEFGAAGSLSDAVQGWEHVFIESKALV